MNSPHVFIDCCMCVGWLVQILFEILQAASCEKRVTSSEKESLCGLRVIRYAGNVLA